MQKKLLTIAVAAALAAPAAMADVTVYGLMHYSVDWVDTGENVTALNPALDSDDDSELNVGVSRQSRIGFKGAEDLGGGLKGVWQIEANIDNFDSGDGNGGFDMRNTFVGLAGGFGTVLLGRHDTPYKISTAKLDFFTDRVGDYNNLLGTINGATAFDERAPQTIAYVTPNWSGFSAAAAYIQHYFKSNNLDSSGNNNPINEVDADSDWGYSLMAMYDNAGFFATAAYEHQEGPNLTGVTWGTPNLNVTNEPEGDAWKVGLGYTFGGTTVGAIYENIELEGTILGDSNSVDRNAWYLTAQHVFGNSVVKGYYGNADDLDADTQVLANDRDTGADIWAVGYDYNFSKRTTLYALYANANNGKRARYGLTGPQSTSDTYTPGLPGEDVQSFSLGVIHKF